MSLQKKIDQDMTELAIKIIRRVLVMGDRTDGIFEGPFKKDFLKVRKMCFAYLDLKKLLKMANSTVKIDTKTSMEAKNNVESPKP